VSVCACILCVHKLTLLPVASLNVILANDAQEAVRLVQRQKDLESLEVQQRQEREVPSPYTFCLHCDCIQHQQTLDTCTASSLCISGARLTGASTVDRCPTLCRGLSCSERAGTGVPDQRFGAGAWY